MTAKPATQKDHAQIERFKALAREVGADKSGKSFDAVVRKLAKAGPANRQPIKARRAKGK